MVQVRKMIIFNGLLIGRRRLIWYLDYFYSCYCLGWLSKHPDLLESNLEKLAETALG